MCSRSPMVDNHTYESQWTSAHFKFLALSRLFVCLLLFYGIFAILFQKNEALGPQTQHARTRCLRFDYREFWPVVPNHGSSHSCKSTRLFGGCFIRICPRVWSFFLSSSILVSHVSVLCVCMCVCIYVFLFTDLRGFSLSIPFSLPPPTLQNPLSLTLDHRGMAPVLYMRLMAVKNKATQPAKVQKVTLTKA